MDKLHCLGALRQGWSQCQGCALAQHRQNIVFGYGSPNAQIMIIGEAPGENEDRSGLPFVGMAGLLLDQFLAETSARDEVVAEQKTLLSIKGTGQEAERRRNEHRIRLRELLIEEFYITNVVMCRPPENRDPLTKEMEACRGRLLEQIYLVDPVLILAAGKFAAEAVIGKKISITGVHGELFDVVFHGRTTIFHYPVMPVLHPAYLLRRNDFKQPGGEGEKTYNDFLRAMHIVDEYNLRHYGIPKPRSRPKLRTYGRGGGHGSTSSLK